MMHSPIQKADMLPATKPDKMFSDAPPCLEQLVTSFTCREVVLTKTLVNSGINAPATVPQLIIAERTHHNFGSGRATSLETPSTVAICGMAKSANISLLAIKVTAIETREVIQTRWVSGASKSKSFLLPYLALLTTSLIK